MTKQYTTFFDKKDRRSLIYWGISNSVYNLFMGSIIGPLAVIGVIFPGMLFTHSAFASILAYTMVSVLFIALFSIGAWISAIRFKAWLVSLPLQYVIGIACELLAQLIFNLSFGVYGIYSKNVPYALIQPLTLLAVQTLILYLRHRRHAKSA